MTDMLITWIVVIVSQSIHISKHQILHLKEILFLFFFVIGLQFTKAGGIESKGKRKNSRTNCRTAQWFGTLTSVDSPKFSIIPTLVQITETFSCAAFCHPSGSFNLANTNQNDRQSLSCPTSQVLPQQLCDLTALFGSYFELNFYTFGPTKIRQVVPKESPLFFP